MEGAKRLKISSRKRPALSTDTDYPTLNSDDKADILDRLTDVRDSYYEIGTMLHLKTSALKSIRNKSPSDAVAMSSVIEDWLNMMYNTDKFGPPTWKMLENAVANPNGGNNHRVAKEIADWHLSDTHTLESQDQAPSQEFSSTKRPALSTSTDDTTLNWHLSDTHTLESQDQAPSQEFSSTKRPALSTSTNDSTLSDVGDEEEEEEFIKGIEEASNESGTIERKIAHFTFLGPIGSGKTSLMKRLLGGAISESTGVCDPFIVVDSNVPKPSTFHSVAMMDSDAWENIDFDVSLLGQMCKDSIIIPSKPTHTSEQGDMPGATDLAGNPRGSFKKNVASIIKKCGFKNLKEYFKKTSSLYLRDTGNHVEFQEVIVGPSVFFFVFRLDLDLKSMFTVEYRKSPGESLNCYTSSMTTEEALLQCLASVYAMDTPDKDSVKTHKPLVFIVGSHADKLGSDATTKIAEINRRLDSIIRDNGFQDLVEYPGNDRKCVAFTIDNTSSSDENDEKFKLIRTRVNTTIHRSEFIIKYPISYLLFCLDLQNVKKSVLTLEECRDLAARYGIVGNQVFHLLHFLHVRIGILRYFNTEGLRHIVVKEPQVLFNKVTNLITTFSCGDLRTSEAFDFKNKGILSASAFKKVCSGNDEISHEDFLRLLVHLRIISRIPSPDDDDTECYFIPCVLSVDKDLKTDNNIICPLFVKFKCKHCPKGLYSVMINHFMRPDEEDNSNTSFDLLPDKIFKDQVSFEVHSPSFRVCDLISLKFHSSHLEITFFPEQSHINSSRNKVCDNIRCIILRFISKSLKDLHYKKDKVDPVMCFRCDDCSDLHPIKIYPIDEGGKCYSLYCRKFHKTIPIPVRGRWWYNEGDDQAPSIRSQGNEEILNTKRPAATGTDDPTLNLIDDSPLGAELTFDDDLGDVYEVLVDLAEQWRTIAINLRLRNGNMNTIESNHSNNVTRCLQLAITDWLSLKYTHAKNGRPSWRMLAKAVCKLDGKLFDKIVHEHPAESTMSIL